MLLYSALITIVGMGSVFVFLLLLMWTVQAMSRVLTEKSSDTDLAQVAAMVAISLEKGGK